MRLKKGIDTLYTYMKALPVIEHWHKKMWEVAPEKPHDTILRPLQGKIH